MRHMHNKRRRRIEFGFVLAVATSFVALGCDDSGGGGSSSSSSSGGGGGGGSSTACIDAATYADVLTIKDEGFCVVASYETDAVSGSLTWGRHGGPMYAEDAGNGMLNVTRLTAPEGTTGKLTSGTNQVNVGLPNGSFFSGQALDLPFFNWTVVGYTSADPMSSGEIILFEGNNVVIRYPINGFYSAAAVGTGEPIGRMIYTGLSPIFKTQIVKNAVYSADACGAVGMNPRLVSDGEPTCSDSLDLDTFGDYSGPVAADAAGNVFVVMASASGEQEARGYAAETMKRGSGMTVGSTLFKVPGFSGALAAIAPDGTGTGVLLFQPKDGTTFEGLDVIAQRFTVADGKVAPQGVAGPMMTPAMAGAVLNFTADDQGRIWVAIERMSGVRVLVIERKA